MAALPVSTTILIVGVGLAGPATALSLLHHGFRDFVIVDAMSQGDNTSRAIAVQAATLEARVFIVPSGPSLSPSKVLDEIGYGDEIVSQGMKITRVRTATRSSSLMRPEFNHLKRYSRHPYVLNIPQSLTEHVFRTKLASLGVSIHRPLKVVGMKRNTENTQLIDVIFEDGRVITTKYVVGADGMRSVIRAAAGIDYKDPTGEKVEQVNDFTNTVVAEIALDEPAQDIHFETTLTSKGLFFCAPLPPTYDEYLVANGHPSLTGYLYRIATTVPLKDGEVPHSPSKEYLQNLIDRFGPYSLSSDPSVNPKSQSVRIKDVVWATPFRNHAAVADTSFTRLGSSGGEPVGGAIFLVGAAALHCPVGGLGMNLGLRDALLLGEVLMKHMQAAETNPLAEADEILRDFAAERHACAVEAIKFAKGAVAVLGTKYTKLRNWGIRLAGMFPFIRRKAGWELSGLGQR